MLKAGVSALKVGVARGASTEEGGDKDSGALQEPRRRSVHFDARPNTAVITHRFSIESQDLDEQEEDEAAVGGDVDAGELLNVPDKQVIQALRRKSAPASALGRLDPGLVAEYHSVELSSTLKALDPELRHGTPY